MDCPQATIFFEQSHITGHEHVQRVDALVEQVSTPLRPDGSPGLLVADREEISSIHLEVGLASSNSLLCCMNLSDNSGRNYPLIMP